MLQPAELAKLLSLCGFELSSAQILDIVTAADVNGDGVIEYEELVPVAREIMSSKKPATVKASVSTGKAAYEWSDIPEDEMDAYLRKLFAVADENGDGVLQPQEFVKLMRLSGLNFPDDVVLEVVGYECVMIGWTDPVVAGVCGG